MMSRAVPWSIKGVDFDARMAAREAARRAGVSLGEWLNEAIADRAAEMGVEEDDLDADDRLEAVTARLGRIRDRGDDERRRPRRRTETYRDDRPRVRRDGARRARDDFDAETLLDDAVAAFERRAERAESRTADALADVAERLGDLESRLSRRPAENGVKPIRVSLERLEERMESLAQRAAPRPDRAVESTLRAFGERLEEISARVGAPSAPAPAGDVARLEEKLGAILEAVREAPKSPAAPAAPAASATMAASAAALAAAQPRPRSFSQRPLADQLADIARRQRDLDEPRRAANPAAPPAVPAEPARPDATVEAIDRRLEQIVARLERAAQRPPAAPAPPDASVKGLQGEIARLADRMEEMRRDAQRALAAPAPPPPEPHPHLDAMRREIAAMSRALSDLAPADSVAALEQAVRDLARRVEASRADGASEAMVAPVARLADELGRNLRQLDPRAALGDIERGVAAIAARLESATARPGDDRQLDELRAQTREIRDLLAASLAKPPGLDRIERQLGALAERVDRLAVMGPVSNPPEIAAAIGEIRAMMAAAVPSGSLDALEARIADLAERVDPAARAPSQAIAATIDEIRTLVGAAAPAGAVQALERQVAGLARRLDGLIDADRDGDAADMARALDDIRGLLASGAPNASIAAIESRLGDLGDRIDRLAAVDRSGPAVADAVAELRAMMTRGGAPPCTSMNAAVYFPGWQPLIEEISPWPYRLLTVQHSSAPWEPPPVPSRSFPPTAFRWRASTPPISWTIFPW